jgi:hypothetical protein
LCFLLAAATPEPAGARELVAAELGRALVELCTGNAARPASSTATAPEAAGEELRRPPPKSQ